MIFHRSLNIHVISSLLLLTLPRSATNFFFPPVSFRFRSKSRNAATKKVSLNFSGVEGVIWSVAESGYIWVDVRSDGKYRPVYIRVSVLRYIMKCGFHHRIWGGEKERGFVSRPIPKDLMTQFQDKKGRGEERKKNDSRIHPAGWRQ